MLNRPSSHDTLLKVVSDVRRRWRVKVALQGAAFALGGVLLTAFLSSWGMDLFRFGTGAVNAFRIITWSAVAVLGWWYLWRPLTRRVSDEQVALYLEEHEPSLDGAVMGAVESGRDTRAGLSPALLERVVETAVERCASVEYGVRVERPGLYR